LQRETNCHSREQKRGLLVSITRTEITLSPKGLCMLRTLRSAFHGPPTPSCSRSNLILFAPDARSPATNAAVIATFIEALTWSWSPRALTAGQILSKYSPTVGFSFHSSDRRS